MPIPSISLGPKDPGGGHKSSRCSELAHGKLLVEHVPKNIAEDDSRQSQAHPARPDVAHGIPHLYTYRESLGTGSQKFMAVVCRGQRTSLNVV